MNPNPDNVLGCLTKLEPRQRGLCSSAWSQGYIATFGPTGIEAISLGAPTRPLGIIRHKDHHKHPVTTRLPVPPCSR